MRGLLERAFGHWWVVSFRPSPVLGAGATYRCLLCEERRLVPAVRSTHIARPPRRDP